MRTGYFIRKDLTFTQDLAAGALSYTTSIGRKFKLEEVSIHFSGLTTETVTVTRDSAAGANYDHVLLKRSLVGEQDLIFRPTGECNFQAGDEVKVECTNAGITIAYGIIKTSEL